LTVSLYKTRLLIAEPNSTATGYWRPLTIVFGNSRPLLGICVAETHTQSSDIYRSVDSRRTGIGPPCSSPDRRARVAEAWTTDSAQIGLNQTEPEVIIDDTQPTGGSGGVAGGCSAGGGMCGAFGMLCLPLSPHDAEDATPYAELAKAATIILTRAAGGIESRSIGSPRYVKSWCDQTRRARSADH
ncbi:MAG: hypothetical protein ACYTFA_07165, partial [Planctomycetota bacterium]